MSFTSTLTLNVKDPWTIEFLGNPSRVMHNVTGKLHLHVQRTVTLKSTSVAFIGEVYKVLLPAYIRTESEFLAKIVCEIPEATGVFQPGSYDFPFTLALSGLLTTTNRDKLQPVELFWSYSLQTFIVPSGLFMRRKVNKYPVTLVRKQIRPSDQTLVRFGAKRQDEFDVTVMVPRMVGLTDSSTTLLVFMHPYRSTHRVRSIQVKAIQIEKVDYTEEKRVVAISGTIPTSSTSSGSSSSQPAPAQAGGAMSPAFLTYESHSHPSDHVQSTRLKDVSSMTSVDNPDQQECSPAWGREQAIEVEVQILPDCDWSPAEEGPFVKISHAFQLTIQFADPSIRPMSVNAPFVAGDILEVLPGNIYQHSHQGVEDILEGRTLSGTTGGGGGGGGAIGELEPPLAPPPDYGDAEEMSTLLDANTGRVARSMLRSEIYPEREPVAAVPDVADDLPPPPTYDDSEFLQGRSSAAREKEEERQRQEQQQQQQDDSARREE